MPQERLAAPAGVCRLIGTEFLPDYFSGLGRRFNRSQEAALPETVRAHLRQAFCGQAEAVRRRVGRIPAAWIKEFGL